MANNYLQFSEVIDNLTPEEEQWWKDQFKVVYIVDGQELEDYALPEDAEWVGCRGYRDFDEGQDDLDLVGFDYEFIGPPAGGEAENETRYIWFYADEFGYVERLGHLVKKFLAKFHPNDYWSLTYANTCSKLRRGEFGGGAIFVTATAIKWNDAYNWVESQCQEFNTNAH
jgi:hypothetical protein